jgi:type IV secretion system protein TrbG
MRPCIVSVCLTSMALAGCSFPFKPPDIAYDDVPVPATLQADPAKPVEVVEIPKPLPLPGQLKPLRASAKPTPEPEDPRKRVDLANAAARVEPSRNGYINAIQIYAYSSGALYQVYAAPGQVTDIALQDGEQLVGTGPVSAGDTVRWIIGATANLCN